MYTKDVDGVLHNCELKATELAREIGARRQYVLEEVLPDWVVMQSGADAGMSPKVLFPAHLNGGVMELFG
jgi:hypothetical protein